MYDRMKMFVYGNSDFASSENTDLKFFIQFGSGNEYYKLTQPVYDTWDEDQKRNEINLDLNWLTSLKNQTTNSINDKSKWYIQRFFKYQRIWIFWW